MICGKQTLEHQIVIQPLLLLGTEGVAHPCGVQQRLHPIVVRQRVDRLPAGVDGVKYPLKQCMK